MEDENKSLKDLIKTLQAEILEAQKYRLQIENVLKDAAQSLSVALSVILMFYKLLIILLPRYCILSYRLLPIFFLKYR